MSDKLRKELNRLVTLPLELLSAKEQESLILSIAKAARSIERAEAVRDLARIEEKIPIEDRRCFLEVRRQFGPLKQQTVKQVEAAVARCQTISRRYRPVIAELKRAAEADALKRIAAFSPDDRRWIALLANVPDDKGGLRKLGAGRKGQLEWRRALLVR